MIDERAFLAQLESANTDELSQILRRPSADEERLLEIYFGAERLERLRSLALELAGEQWRKATSWSFTESWGRTDRLSYESEQSIHWLNFPRVAIGAVGRLR